jgi:hypothetical protein
VADIYKPTPDQEQAWIEWCDTRPPAVRAVAMRFRPWKLYKLHNSGHRVTIYSFGEEEDGTISLTVNVTGKYNALMFERRVFGVKPDGLSECALPDANELVGSANLPIEVVKVIHEIKQQIDNSGNN